MQKVKKAGFTLIELLISISIMGLLLGLLVTNMDKTLSRNRIANDAELFAAKVEEVRLMAGSTQSVDEEATVAGQKVDIGYYGLYVPSNEDTFYIMKLPSDVSSLPASLDDADEYIFQKNELTKNVKVTERRDQLVVYKVPTQQVSSMILVNNKWSIGNPSEAKYSFGENFFKLGYQNKFASVKIGNNLGKVEITYQ